MTKTNFKSIINPEYLGAYSLDNGQDGYNEKVIVITHISQKEVNDPQGKKQLKPVATIKDSKPMILCTTNMKILAKLFGSRYTEDWLNKPVTIHVQSIKAFGEFVDALRIKPILPQIKIPEKVNLTPECSDWVKAKEALISKSTTIEKIKQYYLLTLENEKLLCE